MSGCSSTRSTLGVIVVLAAVLVASLTASFHTGGDPVGQAAVEPTTIYYSQHRSDSDEVHLHAETGFDLVFCLACFLSLQHRTTLESSPTLFALSPAGELFPTGPSSAPITLGPSAFSSRAPPWA